MHYYYYIRFYFPGRRRNEMHKWPADKYIFGLDLLNMAPPGTYGTISPSPLNPSFCPLQALFWPFPAPHRYARLDHIRSALGLYPEYGMLSGLLYVMLSGLLYVMVAGLVDVGTTKKCRDQLSLKEE